MSIEQYNQAYDIYMWQRIERDAPLALGSRITHAVGYIRMGALVERDGKQEWRKEPDRSCQEALHVDQA
jgi:hypothetical protein